MLTEEMDDILRSTCFPKKRTPNQTRTISSVVMARVQWLLLGILCLLYAGVSRCPSFALLLELHGLIWPSCSYSGRLPKFTLNSKNCIRICIHSWLPGSWQAWRGSSWFHSKQPGVPGEIRASALTNFCLNEREFQTPAVGCSNKTVNRRCRMSVDQRSAFEAFAVDGPDSSPFCFQGLSLAAGALLLALLGKNVTQTSCWWWTVAMASIGENPEDCRIFRSKNWTGKNSTDLIFISNSFWKVNKNTSDLQTMVSH